MHSREDKEISDMSKTVQVRRGSREGSPEKSSVASVSGLMEGTPKAMFSMGPNLPPMAFGNVRGHVVAIMDVWSSATGILGQRPEVLHPTRNVQTNV